MSVIVSGMEMPEHCGYCRFRYDGICHALQKTQYSMEECPLVPIPEHGDLIDHNALKIAVMDCNAETRLDFLKHAMDCINKAPVVIPSDMPIYEAEEGE